MSDICLLPIGLGGAAGATRTAHCQDKVRTSTLCYAPRVTYYTRAHDRCRRLWGSAKQYPCVHCGGRATDWAYDHTDPEAQWAFTEGAPYSNWPEFYMPLCKRCHAWCDARWYSVVKLTEFPEQPLPPQPPVTNPRTEAEWDRYFRQRKKEQAHGMG